MKPKRTYSKIARTHFKINERNGSPIVLCGKKADLVSKVTERVEDINCKHCRSRLSNDR